VTLQLPNKLILSILILTGTLLGCANSSSPPNYDLDTYTLGRSSVFTQRELINEQLKDPAEMNTEVRDTLLNSYCDLIAQGAIYVSRDNQPQQCQSLSQTESLSGSQNEGLNNKQRRCAYKYHTCIKTCPLRTDDCQPCIDRAKRCLSE
tara:strand:+ start:52 stop:498 length:447 start_codon:yes stop_codon:yes gene_type:complete